MTIKEFLENVPPGRETAIEDSSVSPRTNAAYGYGGLSFYLKLPELALYCRKCDGSRTFQTEEGEEYFDPGILKYFYAHYKCRNCFETTKVFSIGLIGQKKGVSSIVKKIGEIPPFGPPLPARLLDIAGPDGELLKKGRQCENQGLGIGAAGYYRRVVENQKGRLLNEIVKAAERLDAEPAAIALLKSAAADQSFSRGLEAARDALPSSLYIQGHNPLSILHTALSKLLHELPDDECLKVSHEIREILTLLAERMADAIQSKNRISAAIDRLQKIGPPVIPDPG